MENSMEIPYSTLSNVDPLDDVEFDAEARQMPFKQKAVAQCHAPSPATKHRKSAVEWMELILPCSRWIRTYRWSEYLQSDLLAGITVGVMLVPQAMSYAKLAGLHPIYGLFSGFVPVFVYAIFGSCRQLSVGPVTLVSLMVSNALSGIADPSDELYTELAILLAFMVGAFECMIGLLRLGGFLHFISRSVISGFITSTAIVIALSQAKYFLGYNIESSSKILPLAKSIIAGAGNFSWPPFVMGSINLAIIILMKHLGETRKKMRYLRASGPLTAVILGTIYMKIFHPSSISVVGEIPQGLPKFHFPREFQHAQHLISSAILIAGVAILESVSIAKALATKSGYDLDPNKEVFGLGMGNIVGSFFSAYPTTGAFSRSVVNHEIGAKTGLSGIFMGCTVGCALCLLTPLFKDLPQCVLAAIVISVGISLVDYKEALFLWHVDKKEFLLWNITCITTLFLGVEIGMLVGVSSSLALIIYESANPYIAVLGRLPGTTVYRNTEQHPEAYIYNGIVVIQVDAPIYFANVSYIKDRMREYEFHVSGTPKHGVETERIYFVILEMASVPHIDCSAVQALQDLHQEYKSREIQIAISNPNRKVLQTLSRAGLIELIGEKWCFVSVHDAMKACFQQMQTFRGTASKAGDLIQQQGFLQRVCKQQNGDEFNPDQEPLLPTIGCLRSSSDHSILPV